MNHSVCEQDGTSFSAMCTGSTTPTGPWTGTGTSAQSGQVECRLTPDSSGLPCFDRGPAGEDWMRREQGTL